MAAIDRERALQSSMVMKHLALIFVGLVGCGMPAPPAPVLEEEEEYPDASVQPPDDEEEILVDAAPRPDGGRGGGTQILKQTTSDVVEPNVSIACTEENEDGTHLENSYYRVFDLTAAGITSSFHVNLVEVAVEIADGGDDAVQPVDVKLHTLTGGVLQTGSLTTLATQTQAVTNRVGGILEFDFDTTVPAGSRLVVEVHTPDGSQTGDTFYIGANNDGQSAPGYLRAPECGDEQPTDFAQIGFPLMHMIIEVTGN